MFRRVLFVDGVPPAVSKECVTTPKIVTEFSGWNSPADGGCSHPISRMFVDARIQKIYGGTNEIMKLLISRSL